MSRIHSRRRQSGLTLIETLVAILIFSIVTLGVVPLLASSLRGSEISQSSTVAKNLVVEAMERARGLPFYVTDARNSDDVDLLDLYFPDQPNSGATSYRTTCTSGDVSPACPLGASVAGYDIVYLATFVNGSGAAVPPAPDIYDAHPDAAGENDSPPTSLMRLQITASWDVFGNARTFDLQSLFSNRDFGSDDLRGSALIDYVVRASTSYDTTPQTDVSVLAGTSESSIQSRSASITAAQQVSAAQWTATGGTSSNEEGTNVALQAPPSSVATNSPRAPASPLNLPGIGDVADIESSDLSGPPSAPQTETRLGVSPEYARGGFEFDGVDPLGNIWVDKPEATRDIASALRLRTTSKLVSVAPAGGAPLSGYTFVDAATPGGTGLTTGAASEFSSLQILPTSFAPTGVVRVTDFAAEVSCNSTSFGLPDAPTATWSADVIVSIDPAEESSGTGPRSTVETGDELEDLSSDSTSDPLAALGPIAASAVTGSRDPRNPMVFEDSNEPAATTAENSSPGDVYLFPQDHVHPVRNSPSINHSHRGYLESWQSRVGVVTRAGGGDDPASASITEILGISTVPLPTATGTTPPLFLSVGSMSCEALDTR